MISAAALVVGPASRELGRRLAVELDIPAIVADLRSFPDGETCVSAEIPPDLEQVVIVQGTHGPQDTHLQQLYQLVEIAAARRARKIVCVTPYLAYARQDRRGSPSEPLSVQIVLRTLAMLGATDLITVDVHNPGVFGVGPLRAVSLSAAGLFVEHLRAQEIARPILVSPDEGGRERTRAIASKLDLPFWVYSKSKDVSGRTWFEAGSPEVGGRHAVIIDDLCSSGSTLVPLVEQLTKDRASGVSICITHLLAEPERLRTRIGQPYDLLCTDSIPTAPANVLLAPTLARRLEALSIGAKS